MLGNSFNNSTCWGTSFNNSTIIPHAEEQVSIIQTSTYSRIQADCQGEHTSRAAGWLDIRCWCNTPSDLKIYWELEKKPANRKHINSESKKNLPLTSPSHMHTILVHQSGAPGVGISIDGGARIVFHSHKTEREDTVATRAARSRSAASCRRSRRRC